VRIALIGDSHGFVPALEAALAVCRAASPDLLIFCGDLITLPFSPDPHGESIELLRAEDVHTIYGNHDVALRAWGTSEWDEVMGWRSQRGYKPGPWVSMVPKGQAQLTADELAWLRSLPGELTFDGGRVYVCHAIPGNPFLSLDGSDRRENVDPAVREAALRQPKPAAAELVLCGHSHVPQAFCRRSPQGHGQTVVRTGAAIGWSQPPGSATRQGGYTVLTRCGGDWEIEFGLVPWRPRDPAWTWRGSLEAAGYVFPPSP
jgi:predicted phosphodiesterase